MNSLKKIYCRTFQGVMRLAFPFFPYRDPKLLNSLEEIVGVLKEKNIDRVILVTDKGIRGLGLSKDLEEILASNGITCSVFDDTVANPTIENVENARKMYLEADCQGIITLGGGSAMDCAKALGARIVRPNKTLQQMKGLIQVRKTLPTLIAIPTTAGTGSETTLAAVITDEKTHHKYPVNDFCLIPHYAVLLPELTIGLPPSLTSTTGMDALTHAMEVYVGRAGNKETEATALEAIKLIFKYLPIAYADGKNMEARQKMLHASFLAGTAFSKSYVGYVHAVAHSLGGKYGIPHGLANAVLLPQVLRAFGDAITEPLAKLAYEVGLADASVSKKEAAERFLDKIEAMNKEMNIPTRFEGIVEADIPALAVLADKEANPLYPVPVLWDAKELEAIYRKVM